MSSLEVSASRGLRGRVKVPGDKSISHRAVILGSIAEGKTEIHNFLAAGDPLSTVNCFRAMGVDITVEGDRAVVHGAGLRGLAEPGDVLDCGNSGTTMRLLLGLLAGNDFYATLTGDHSLRQRPMRRVVTPLRSMGACIFGRLGGENAPLSVAGRRLSGKDFRLPVASAQVKSALLLAGLYAEGSTGVEEPFKSRDHSERMMRAFGCRIETRGLATRVHPAERLVAQKVRVPGDISSAAFFMVAATLVPGSEVLLESVGVNPTRAGIIDVLRAMGARIEVLATREEDGEPVADLLVRSAPVHGIEIGGESIPGIIDEVPVLAVAGAFAEGRTVLRDCSELRVKETDRLAVMASELGKLGAEVTETPDGLIIDGRPRLKGARVDAHGDHRIAMALAVAGLASEETTAVEGWECTAISYPGFEDHLRALSSF